MIDRLRQRFFSQQNLLSLYLPAFTLALGNGIAAPALPVYAKSFDVDFGVAALVIIIYEVGGLLATIPTGFMMDRFGRRRILLAGPILVAIASVLVATAHSFPELLVYRFVGGWARQMWMLSRLTVISDTGASESRGRQISGMIGFEGMGRLMGPAVGGFVAAATDVRVPFLLHAVLALLAIAPSFKLVKESMPGSAARQAADVPAGERRTGAMAALLTVPVIMFFVAQFLASFARGTLIGGSVQLYAVYQYAVGPEVLGALASATAVIAIPIMFSTGHLMDRFGRTVTAVPGFLLLSVALVFVAATDFAHLPFSAFVVSLFVTQASQSLTAGNMQVIGSVIAPEHMRGRFFGVWRLIGEIGSTASPAMFAVLSTQHSYAAGFLSLSVAALGAAVLLWTHVRRALGETRVRGGRNAEAQARGAESAT